MLEMGILLANLASYKNNLFHKKSVSVWYISLDKNLIQQQS